MHVVFLTNYFSHHQQPLCEALASRGCLTVITTAEVSEERVKLGWGSGTAPDYVCSYDQEPDRAQKAMEVADVVIAGHAPQALVRRCIQRGQLVFRYSERPLKNGAEWHKYLPRLVKWHVQNPAWKPIYMLCASAFTAGDYARFGLFRGKAFRWGYFPEVKRYASAQALLSGKQQASILWVGRFLDWKHPDDAIRVAARLKAVGYDFRLDFIGTGPMEQTMRDMIEQEGLQEQVRLLGTMKPGEVRAVMEQSQIFLFTSDRREGWGAVLNEAMNSCCAVVASDAAGATPYLVRNEENGCVYRFSDMDALYERVKGLLDDPDRAGYLGARAYETMLQSWNAEVAAERFLELAALLLRGVGSPELYGEGPCSKA